MRDTNDRRAFSYMGDRFNKSIEAICKELFCGTGEAPKSGLI